MPPAPTRSARLVDTHCHVDLFSDPAGVVRETEKHQVYTIAVTNTPSVFSHLCGIIGNSRFVRPALGLHPELAPQRHRELSLFTELLPQTRYIGEVGLDYQTTAESERVVQRRVLTTIVEQCDAVGGKIVTAHSRRAAEDVVSAFGEGFRGAYILHWYSGAVRTLKRAVANGAYFSVNPAMMRSDRGRTLVSQVPRERVLTETDGPFVSVDDAPALPYQVHLVVDELARLWGVSPDEARSTVRQNLSAVLRGRDGRSDGGINERGEL